MCRCSEEYDELYAKAQTEVDRDARDDIYIQMQELMEEAKHSVWVSHPTVFVASRTNTVEVITDPVGNIVYPALTPR